VASAEWSFVSAVMLNEAHDAGLKLRTYAKRSDDL
jgi:hypothetical protein